MPNDDAWLPRLTVDLDALAANYRCLVTRARASVAAVVKADAYGLGMAAVAHTLWDAGCRTFFVAFIDEGIALRAALPEAEIIVLVPPPVPAPATLRAHRLVPALYERHAIDELAATAGDGAPLPVALHVESGIHRLALDAEELARLARDGLPAGLAPVLLMSHLATADEPHSSLAAEQRRRFVAAAEAWPGVRRSLANSAGTLADDALHFELVRPGLVLYGADPAAGALAAGLATVATFELPVLQVRELPAGATIGYGATETTKRPTRLAILGGGYADGVTRLAGERGNDGLRAPVACKGERLRYCGRVSMDLVAVDVTDLPAAAVEVGERFEVFGKTIGIDEFARHCQTLPYEVLTGIGGRTRRHYTGTGRGGP